MRDRRTRPRSMGLLVAAILACSSFLFLPLTKNVSASSWVGTNAIGWNADGGACVLMLQSTYILCMQAAIGTPEYTTYNNGVTGNWIATTAPTFNPASNTAILCFSDYNTHVWCMTQYGNPVTGTKMQYATFTGSGITAAGWQDTSSPNQAVWNSQKDNSCDVYGRFAWCVGNSTGVPAGKLQIDWSLINADGTMAGWQSVNGGSGVTAGDAQSCKIDTISLYMFCGSNWSTFSTNTYYFSISPLGLPPGTIHSGRAYPLSLKVTDCEVVSSTMYCVGGEDSGNAYHTQVYASAVSNGGFGVWNAMSAYPSPVGWQECVGDNVGGTLECQDGLTTGNAFLHTANYLVAGPPALFTCRLLNADAGNYMLPTGKVYNIQCSVASNAINAVNAAITDVRIQFNDSLNNVVIEYANNTNIQDGVGFKLLNGSAIASLGTGGGAVSTYFSSTGQRQIVVTFAVAFSTNLVDSANRGFYLFALNNNFQAVGYSYLGNSFNFLNHGGGISVLSHGACSIPASADTFQTECHYGTDAHNWIAENATYYQLQNYQAQFAAQLTNQSNSVQVGYYWQNYANSGAGTNPSSNKGDWFLQYGLYYFDNSTWVKGINVKMEMFDGRVGSNNLWTGLTVLWYNGNTLTENDTIYNFVPATNLSQVNFWVNLWYSQNNASTTQGGQVGAFYTGMHKTNYLIWSGSWSPFLENSTQSQIFVPLKDHTGVLMPAQNAQFTKVFMNMSRPGAPLVNAKQYNFQIETLGYKEQEFNTASAGMGGITTPTFTGAIVPIIASSSIFSPIINAIKAIATYISKAFIAIGNLIWGGLASRFPWFTGFWSSAASFLVQGAIFVGTAIVYVISFISLLPRFFSPIVTIIGLIGSAWNTIQGIYLPIFKGTNLSAMITIVVLWVFSGWFLENAQEGNTTEIAKGATLAWRIFNAILYWTFWFAKLLIDTLEGLIP